MTGSEYRPNPAQAKAIAHVGGALRILAGAGSGKTTTLVRRIGQLIAGGHCSPGEILMLTFTTKAADDMRRKVAAALPPDSPLPQIDTYHAFALSLVREFAPELGLPSEPVLLTEGPAKLFARRHFDRLGIQAMDLGRLDAAVAGALDFFGWHWHEATYLEDDEALLARLHPEAADADLLRELLAAHRAWRELLRESGAADYDDLIALAVQLLEEHPQVRQALTERYRFILVDEYQDTDHLQGRMIRLLAAGHGNITIVGDPDQTIYSFRGAAIANIMQFHEAFAGLTEIPMVTNYRSTPAIVAAANAVIRHNQRRKAEELVPDREQGDSGKPLLVQAPDWVTEARWIVREMQRLHAADTPWKAMTVLVRANKHKLPLYAALVEAGIPARVVGGMDLFADAETARFVSYLRALAAPEADGDLSVAMGMPRYGLTDADIARLGRERQAGERLIDVAARLADSWPAVKAFLGEFWPLYKLQFTEGCEAAIRGALTLHGGGLGLQARLNADQLLPLAQGFLAQGDLLADPNGSVSPLGRFCEYLSALRDVGDSPEGVALNDDEDAVRLMTVHSAKGLEFPVVFLPRLTDRDFHPKGAKRWDKLFPLAWHHDPELQANLEQVSAEEERRLFYVAVTRAMDRLYLSWAPADPARKRPVGPSQFLAELGDTVDLLELPGAAAVEEIAAVGEEEEVEAVPQGEVAAVPDGEVAAVHGDGGIERLLGQLLSRGPARPLPAPAPVAPFAPKPPAVLSFSHLSAYQFCPYRYYLQYVLRLPGRPTRAADAGVRIHAAIERLAEARSKGEAVGFDDFQAWAAAPPLPEEATEIDEAPDVGEDLSESGALQNFWASEYGRTEPVAAEQEFYVTLGGAVVRGFIDRIHRREDGTVEVVDFKTYGQAMNETDVRASLQLPIYIKACREALGLAVNTGAMYFLKHDRTVRVTYTEEELADRWREAERTIAGARGGDWDPTPGTVCRYCPYGEICPVSRAAE